MTKISTNHASDLRGWSIIVYRVPSSPSTARVTVWKRVKELGALPLQQSVYILPAMPELKESLKNLRQQILDFGGECRILDTASIDGKQEDEIVEGFNALRNQEYEEILDECVAFDQEIDKETKAGKFYFAEEEEIEKRLEGLNRWFDIVAGRDFFGAEMKAKVTDALSDCRVGLDAFGQEVFSREQALAAEAKGSISLPKQRGSAESRKKIREVLGTDALLARLRRITADLEKGSLSVGKEEIKIGTAAVFQMKYQPREGTGSLEIHIEWEQAAEGVSE